MLSPISCQAGGFAAVMPDEHPNIFKATTRAEAGDDIVVRNLTVKTVHDGLREKRTLNEISEIDIE